jgi:hypothetical protein
LSPVKWGGGAFVSELPRGDGTPQAVHMSLDCSASAVISPYSIRLFTTALPDFVPVPPPELSRPIYGVDHRHLLPRFTMSTTNIPVPILVTGSDYLPKSETAMILDFSILLTYP